MPVWVDVMNASREDFPSNPLKAPVTVEQVEVCRLSGELATDKCVERFRPAGGAETVESTVYTEYARIGRAPSVACSVHAGGVKSYVKEYEEEEWPRAAAAVDLSKVRPIDVSSPPVLGAADPYNAISPARAEMFGSDVPVAEAVQVAALPETVVAASANGAAVPAEVRKAEPAGVKDAVAQERPAMDLPPPPPIRF
jgi:penicillin-binding protein 1A